MILSAKFFPFWFRGWDAGFDCISSWRLPFRVSCGFAFHKFLITAFLFTFQPNVIIQRIVVELRQSMLHAKFQIIRPISNSIYGRGVLVGHVTKTVCTNFVPSCQKALYEILLKLIMWHLWRCIKPFKYEWTLIFMHFQIFVFAVRKVKVNPRSLFV